MSNFALTEKKKLLFISENWLQIHFVWFSETSIPYRYKSRA